MKVLVQRVKKASVKVEEKTVGEIKNGLLLFVGFTEGDSLTNIREMAKKVVNLRIMDDENGIMNKSVLDTNGSILSVSQFTLYADTKKGNRPSYVGALKGELACPLYDLFNEELRNYLSVETGVFGAEMEVSLINDGPITIILEK